MLYLFIYFFSLSRKVKNAQRAWSLFGAIFIFFLSTWQLQECLSQCSFRHKVTNSFWFLWISLFSFFSFLACIKLQIAFYIFISREERGRKKKQTSLLKWKTAFFVTMSLYIEIKFFFFSSSSSYLFCRTKKNIFIFTLMRLF